MSTCNCPACYERRGWETRGQGGIAAATIHPAKPRHQRLEIRLHAEDMDRLRAEARSCGLSLSDYVRKLLGCPQRR